MLKRWDSIFKAVCLSIWKYWVFIFNWQLTSRLSHLQCLVSVAWGKHNELKLRVWIRDLKKLTTATVESNHTVEFNWLLSDLRSTIGQRVDFLCKSRDKSLVSDHDFDFYQSPSVKGILWSYNHDLLFFQVLRLVRVTRILRVFKLVRHFAGLQSLFCTLRQAGKYIHPLKN